MQVNSNYSMLSGGDGHKVALQDTATALGKRMHDLYSTLKYITVLFGVEMGGCVRTGC